MRSPEQVLKALNKHGKVSDYKFERLYRILFNEEMFHVAYQRIYAKPGNMTPGTDGKTINRMSLQRINKVIASLRDESYKPNPAKRIYIPKKNGKKRPLGIPSFEDKLVQEVVRMILEAVYEEVFANTSHGFRPNRSCHTALTHIQKTFTGTKWFVEGDIKGFFDNIDHNVLIATLRKRIADDRFLRLIRKLLNAGYIEDWKFHNTNKGTPQGGNISPILANIYLDNFDKYMEEYALRFNKGKERHITKEYKQLSDKMQRILKSIKNIQDADVRLQLRDEYEKLRRERQKIESRDSMDETYRRLRYVRYADDFLIGVIGSKAECVKIKSDITNYMEENLKLELSQEKTYVTDLRKNGIHFLGYIVKAERKRKTPDPATWSDNLVGKPFPDMERLTKKIHTLQKEVREIGLYTQSNTQAAQIQYVNSVIMGLAQYLQPSICSHAYHAIDRRVNNTALAVWKNLFPKQYNQMQVPLKELSNLPHRHEGYDSKTFAIQIDGKWFGITYAFITHSRYESKPFDQKMTPYTEDGRRRYVNYRTKHKPLPCDRPSINTPEDIALSIYASGKGWKANFEYFMNREYAYNRDKGKCKCCGRYFSELIPKHCHHVNPRLPIERINKVPNLAWLCIPCHRMVHNSPIPPELDAKAVRKIKKYREKLKK